jgi:hypothetical protein
MDHETDEQNPSGKEGRQMKVGDKVWVKATVDDADSETLRLVFDENWVVWVPASDCRPVEPAIERDLQKFSPGDSIRVASPLHEWHNKLGEVLCFDTQGDDFISYMVKLHDLDYAAPIPSHLMRLNNPRPTKEPTEAQKLAERTMKAIWAANDSVNEPPVIKESLTTESNSSEIPNSSSEPLAVGDPAVVVEPAHKWHGVRGRIVSVSESNEFPLEFISDCRKRLGYFRSSSIERINKADPINPSHYKHLPAEAIDIIEAAIAGAPSNKAAYLHGQSLKYPLRCWEKGGVDDLKKARWYLDRLIKEVGE